MEDFLKKLADLSPTIGSTIAGPIGGIVGLGVKAIAQALTGETEPDKVVAALSADPDKLADFELKVKSLELDHLRANLADVQDARKQTVALAAAGSKIAWGAPIISCIVLCGFFFCIFELFIVKTEFATETANLLNQLFGALIVMATSVVAYWVGSSAGSESKSVMLNQALQTHMTTNNVIPFVKKAA